MKTILIMIRIQMRLVLKIQNGNDFFFAEAEIKVAQRISFLCLITCRDETRRWSI